MASIHVRDRAPLSARFWRKINLAAAVAGFLIAAIGGSSPLTAAAAPSSPSTTQYYVALGDSLANGAPSYVASIYQHELSTHPNLQLVDLAVPGETSASMLSGNQLSNAESFLRAHAGQVALLTIDIGANDVAGCASLTSINQTCVQQGTGQVQTNLQAILTGLRSAYSGLPIYGMTYYDPFLAFWLNGSAGQSVAQQSVPDAVMFNSALTQVYTGFAAPTADVASTFQTTNFALTGSWNGSVVPENVALICDWTFMCPNEDIHANVAGIAQIASTFEPLIDSGAPASPATTTEPSAPRSTTVGQVATYSVAVVGYTVPSGSVDFSVGSTNLCTTSLTPSPTAFSIATGSCISSASPPGIDTVTADYSGDGVFNPSTGGTTILVTNASPSVTCQRMGFRSAPLLGSCLPRSKTDKIALTGNLGLRSGMDTLTWSPSGLTTTMVLTSTYLGHGACPKAKELETDYSGISTGGTSPYVKANDPVSIKTCSGRLLPGTVATL